jgi:hypothetical protein
VKNTFALLALGLMMAGSVACSSTPKQEETAAPAVAEAAPVEAPVATEAPASNSDLSLGTGSSGRGH